MYEVIVNITCTELYETFNDFHTDHNNDNPDFQNFIDTMLVSAPEYSIIRRDRIWDADNNKAIYTLLFSDNTKMLSYFRTQWQYFGLSSNINDVIFKNDLLTAEVSFNEGKYISRIISITEVN
jgi:hypothetical protein